MSSSIDVSKLDLYKILEVEETATEKEIIRSYRKQARKCHPDKNPDNPLAAELFHKLSKALEVLTDAAARAAYDKIQKAKKAAEARHRVLDSKRKKLKEDLEARESAAFSQKEQEFKASRNLQAEIERLRKEGSKLLEHEQELLKEEIRNGSRNTAESDEEKEKPTPKLKVRWKAKKSDEENGGYSYTLLYSLFQKYGNVLNLVVSGKKNGSAIVEFQTGYAAESAVKNEIGLVDNPLTLTWIGGKISSPQKEEPSQTVPIVSTSFKTKETTENVGRAQTTVDSRDYESLVLMKMRQAEERRKLIEQMKEEDEKDAG